MSLLSFPYTPYDHNSNNVSIESDSVVLLLNWDMGLNRIIDQIYVLVFTSIFEPFGYNFVFIYFDLFCHMRRHNQSII